MQNSAVSSNRLKQKLISVLILVHKNLTTENLPKSFSKQLLAYDMYLYLEMQVTLLPFKTYLKKPIFWMKPSRRLRQIRLLFYSFLVEVLGFLSLFHVPMMTTSTVFVRVPKSAVWTSHHAYSWFYLRPITFQ
ncbi:hypothetical protein D3C71_1479840 [compost metagenome]